MLFSSSKNALFQNEASYIGAKLFLSSQHFILIGSLYLSRLPAQYVTLTLYAWKTITLSVAKLKVFRLEAKFHYA